jgi:H+/Cl- antiporter ClcA
MGRILTNYKTQNDKANYFTDTAMKKYLPYLIGAVLIICSGFLLWWFTYTKTKFRLTKREIYLLLLILGLVMGALVFTYFQTGGTFRW